MAVSRPARARRPGSSARRGRLSRSSEFERVYRQGRSHGNRHLVLYAFPRQEQATSRVGVSVSRKVGGAVERNRVKRLLREAFASREEAVLAPYDFVVVARPEVAEVAVRAGLAGVSETLDELLEEAGVLGEGTAR